MFGRLAAIWDNFTLESAISLEKLEQMRDTPVSSARLISVATGLDGVPALAVTERRRRISSEMGKGFLRRCLVLNTVRRLGPPLMGCQLPLVV